MFVAEDEPRSEWESLRRTHFFINDLFFREAQRIGVGVMQRRIFDYIDYAQDRGSADGVTIATLGDLIPPPTRPQQLSEVLSRMQARGWVDQLEERSKGRRRGRLWQITKEGQEVRSVYKQTAEEILSNVYRETSEADELNLLSLGEKATCNMDADLGQVVVIADPRASDRLTLGRTWSAIRQTHFYLNDLFFKTIDPLGIRVLERRILDSLGMADARDAEIGVATMSDLIAVPTPPQTIISALNRMNEWEWVAESSSGKTRTGRRWHLTSQGKEIRTHYKKRIEDILRRTYQVGSLEEQSALLRAAVYAEEYRNRRVDLIVTLALQNETGAV